MGYYTWTLANRPLKQNKQNTDFLSSSKLGYGTPCRVVCPDDTCILEHSYDGYGEFGGQDIFMLLADWNKDCIPALCLQDRSKTWQNTAIQPVALKFAKYGIKAAHDLAQTLPKPNIFQANATPPERCTSTANPMIMEASSLVQNLSLPAGSSHSFTNLTLFLCKHKRTLLVLSKQQCH